MKKFLILIAFLMAVMPSDARTKVTFVTTLGDFTVELYDETPLHRDNFLKLVDEGFYDGLLFHRVIENFMIQGGDPQSKDAVRGQRLGEGDLGYKIPAEIRLPKIRHFRGALAAAREPDFVNPNHESSACQFYIVWGETKEGTPHLDGDYTVFGKVVKGLNVIEKIQQVETDRNDRPIEDVQIILLRRSDSNGRPPGYEPGELPTAPLRDLRVQNYE